MSKDIKQVEPQYNNTKTDSSNQKSNPGPGGHGPMKGFSGEKAKDFKGAISKLAVYLAKYKLKIVITIIFTIGSTIFFIVGPKILGNVTTSIFEGFRRKISGTG